VSGPTNKTTTDAIARLEKRVEVLEAALRPMIEVLEGNPPWPAPGKGYLELIADARRALGAEE